MAHQLVSYDNELGPIFRKLELYSDNVLNLFLKKFFNFVGIGVTVIVFPDEKRKLNVFYRNGSGSTKTYFHSVTADF